MANVSINEYETEDENRRDKRYLKRKYVARQCHKVKDTLSLHFSRDTVFRRNETRGQRVKKNTAWTEIYVTYKPLPCFEYLTSISARFCVQYSFSVRFSTFEFSVNT